MTGLWSEVRGVGDPLLVLLHGLNATAGVWEPFDAAVVTSWPGRRLLIDMPGHGESGALPEYTFGAIAAEVANVVAPLATDPVVIVGHSMGAVTALTLASGWFGIPIERVLTVGLKTEWTTEELEVAASARHRSVKWYDTYGEAESRFVRLAGLAAVPGATPELLARGVRSADGRYRVAADPRASSIGPPLMDGMMPAARVPIRLACGDHDAMVKIDHLRAFDREAIEIPNAGHNAHLDNPAALAQLL